MFLEIKNPDGLDLSDFCDKLITLLKDYATDPQNQNAGLIKSWNDYFQATDLGWPVDGVGNPVPPTVQYIISQWFGHLDWFSSGDAYYIIPDDNLRLNSSEVTIDSLAQMINYGVLGVAAYNYFDEVFETAAGQLSQLYGDWTEAQEGEQL